MHAFLRVLRLTQTVDRQPASVAMDVLLVAAPLIPTVAEEAAGLGTVVVVAIAIMILIVRVRVASKGIYA